MRVGVWPLGGPRDAVAPCHRVGGYPGAGFEPFRALHTNSKHGQNMQSAHRGPCSAVGGT
eukprot:5399516-Prymnesium_polylepis.3